MVLPEGCFLHSRLAAKQTRQLTAHRRSNVLMVARRMSGPQWLFAWCNVVEACMYRLSMRLAERHLGVIKSGSAKWHLMKASCGLVQSCTQHCLVCANDDESGGLIHLKK